MKSASGSHGIGNVRKRNARNRLAPGGESNPLRSDRISDFWRPLAGTDRSAEFIPQQRSLSTIWRNEFRAPKKSEMRTVAEGASPNEGATRECEGIEGTHEGSKVDLVPEQVVILVAQHHLQAQKISESGPDPELPGPFKPILELAVEGFHRTAANGTALSMDLLVL